MQSNKKIEGDAPRDAKSPGAKQPAGFARLIRNKVFLAVSGGAAYLLAVAIVGQHPTRQEVAEARGMLSDCQYDIVRNAKGTPVAMWKGEEIGQFAQSESGAFPSAVYVVTPGDFKWTDREGIHFERSGRSVITDATRCFKGSPFEDYGFDRIVRRGEVVPLGEAAASNSN